MRLEANRRIKPNDIFNFWHAAAALSYYRTILTDGPLSSPITSGHARLDRLYDCEIAATPAETIDLIGRLALGRCNNRATMITAAMQVG